MRTKAPMQVERRDQEIGALASDEVLARVKARGVCDRCKRGNVGHCVTLDHHRSHGGFAKVIKARYTSVYPSAREYQPVDPI